MSPPAVTRKGNSRGDKIFGTVFACLCAVTAILAIVGFAYFVDDYQKSDVVIGVRGSPTGLGFFFTTGVAAVLAGVLLTPHFLRGETLFFFALGLCAMPTVVIGLVLLIYNSVIAVVTVPWLVLLACGLYRGAKESW